MDLDEENQGNFDDENFDEGDMEGIEDPEGENLENENEAGEIDADASNDNLEALSKPTATENDEQNASQN